MNFEKFAPNVELNNIQGTMNMRNKRGVQIFSEICSGKDVSKYGKEVDDVLAYMKNIGGKAVNGDPKAQAEINAIKEVLIETPLVKRLNIFSYIGDYQAVPYNTELKYKAMQLQGKKANIQANSGSFPFPTQTWRTGTISTITISGGTAVDYREVAAGNVDNIGMMTEQVITDMFNQMFYNVVTAMYNAVKTIAVAGGLTAFSENAGLNQVAVDDALKLIRRWGSTTIAGDYSVITQLEAFTGFQTTAGTVQFSEAIMEEIRKTGLLKSYRGTPIVEIPNTYNVSKINATGGIGGTSAFYETYLPEGLLFVTPKIATGSPLQVGIKGGLTSMSGQDLATKQIITRYDMEFGSTVIDSLVPTLGLLSDSNFDVNKA
jgi:hypothetical protein